MRLPSKALIDRLRQQFPHGCRVELLRMKDAGAPPIGTQGTIFGVDDIGSILVNWDSGSGLNVAFGVDLCMKL